MSSIHISVVFRDNVSEFVPTFLTSTTPEQLPLTIIVQNHALHSLYRLAPRPRHLILRLSSSR